MALAPLRLFHEWCWPAVQGLMCPVLLLQMALLPCPQVWQLAPAPLSVRPLAAKRGLGENGQQLQWNGHNMARVGLVRCRTILCAMSITVSQASNPCTCAQTVD